LSLLILSNHKRFTDKTLNHITYIDKQLWESSDNKLKQQILSDAQENNNTAIVTYDVEIDQKEIIYSPSNSQSLIFNTVEVIARDTERQNVDLKKNCIDFVEKQGCKQNYASIFFQHHK
jgi:hypothetical protein